MYRRPVSSSNLASVGYDVDRRVLEVRFRSGGTYQYRGVPAAVHAALMGAPSKGSYLARAIKDVYPWVRLG